MLVEPDQPQEVIPPDTSKQVKDAARLTCCGRHGGLRDKHRVTGDAANSLDGAAEKAGESDSRTYGVPVDADPCDVRATAPPSAPTGDAIIHRPNNPQP